MLVETAFNPVITEIDPKLAAEMRQTEKEVLESFDPVLRPEGLSNQKLDPRYSGENGSYAEQHPVPVSASPVEPDINALFPPLAQPDVYTMRPAGRLSTFFFGPTASPVSATSEAPSWLTPPTPQTAAAPERSGRRWLKNFGEIFSNLPIGKNKQAGKHRQTA